MKMIEIKQNLRTLIDKTDNSEVLERVNLFFEMLLTDNEADWWDSISTENKQRVEKSVNQLDSNQHISHLEHKKNTENFFLRHG